MTPIVDRLEETYAETVDFRRLNAVDQDEGQRIFTLLGLPGHPSFVVFTAGGAETFRAFSILEESDLAAQIDAALAAD